MTSSWKRNEENAPKGERDVAPVVAVAVHSPCVESALEEFLVTQLLHLVTWSGFGPSPMDVLARTHLVVWLRTLA